MYFCLDPCERTCTGASRQSCEVWRLSRMQYQLASCCVVVLQHAGGARRNPQGERYLSRFRGRRLYVRYDATKIVSSSSSSPPPCSEGPLEGVLIRHWRRMRIVVRQLGVYSQKMLPKYSLWHVQ